MLPDPVVLPLIEKGDRRFSLNVGGCCAVVGALLAAGAGLAFVKIFLGGADAEVGVLVGAGVAAVVGLALLAAAWYILPRALRPAFLSIGSRGIDYHAYKKHFVRWDEIAAVGIGGHILTPSGSSLTLGTKEDWLAGRGEAVATESVSQWMSAPPVWTVNHARIRIAGTVPGLPRRRDLARWRRTTFEPEPYTHVFPLPVRVQLPESLPDIPVEVAAAALEKYAGPRYTGIAGHGAPPSLPPVRRR
ncbi:MAG: hypothetical protein FWF21_04390 [Micrococcales bacterium]|nr:hypothetical protein [Micrococcales bacterium]